jgi:hypothetical protein
MRVVVWSTGGVGTIAIHSPEKVGKDAGELAGGDIPTTLPRHVFD